ncbi:MAG: small multi-drug export protein, partial [Ignisphaera sp.]|nr:small multi-drug export protein [Ignisphaera sp.]
YIDRFIRSSKNVPAILRSAYIKVLDYVQRKSKRFENYEVTALALFVGVPLPATGAWTGSLIAFLLGMDRRKALVAVELGVLIASIIVFAASYAGIAILKKIFYLQ